MEEEEGWKVENGEERERERDVALSLPPTK